jgi:hypothetical protein
MEEEKEPWLVEAIVKFWNQNVKFVENLVWNIETGIKNYYKWRKIIWLDHQWDYSYLLNMLKFKLELMEKYFRLNGVSVDGPEDSKKIKRCVELLDRLIKDNYHDIAYELYNKKYREDVEDFLNSRKFNTPMTPEQKIDFNNAAQTEEDLIKSDYEELFSIMNKEIRRWWD